MGIWGFVRSKWLYLLILVLALALPLAHPNRYWFQVVIISLVWSIATLSLNLILGYTGQPSLAHGAYFGVGAYAVGLLTLKLHMSFWLALPTAGVLAALVGLIIGVPSMRMRGHYFAIGTLCFGVIIYTIAGNWMELTGGFTGLLGIPNPNAIPIPGIGRISFANQINQYYLVLVLLLITLFVMHRIVYSLVGYGFMAIRNNEVLAAAVGINTFRNKLLSLTISNFIVGVAGGLYAVILGSISPSAAHFNITFYLLLYLLLGGVASLAGPILGAFALPLIMENLQFISEYRNLVFGPLLIIVIIYWPRGVMGGLVDLKQRVQNYYQFRKAGAARAVASAETDQAI